MTFLITTPGNTKLMMRLKTFILLLLILVRVDLEAQQKTVTYYADPNSIPSDLPIRIKHLKAEVDFVPEQNLVNGTAVFTFSRNRRMIDSIVFHTPGFTIHDVGFNNQKADYRRSGTNLILYPRPSDSSANTISIKYAAKPMSGYIYFIGWRPEESGKRKQIWAHRPQGWLPYMDARLTVDLFIRFDKRYKVFSNGERKEIVQHDDSTSTWHYCMEKDHPFFSTALVIGDYNFVSTKSRSGVPLELWHYPEMADRIGTTYMHTEKMFDFLENEFGYPYPYPLYREAPVIDYMYGAMETTTSTIFGDYMQISPRSWWQRNYVNVNVHELAHQWFGNCVAHLVNKDVWLTESFATYYAKIFEKWIYGEDYWQNLRNDEFNLVFEAAKKNDMPVGGSQSGVQRIYYKGSLVLEMLRIVMGDDEFKEAVNLYLKRYAFGYAETNDFIRCTYDATGMSYFWFFDQWILRGGEPDYLVTDSVETDLSGNLSTVFRVRQVQPVNELTGLFRMPIKFQVHYTDGLYDETVQWIENAETNVSIPNPLKKEIDYLLFDPGRAVLKQVTFIQSAERMMAQAIKAKEMIDRYDALCAMRGLPLDKKLSFLKQLYDKENFHLMKSEILRQLDFTSSEISLDIISKALNDPSAFTRKSALQSLVKFPESLRPRLEEMLYDSSYVNVEFALDALCVSFPDRIPEYLDRTIDMEGWRGKNIRIKWLEIAIQSGQRAYLAEVIGYCTPRYEFETRINAFNLLRKMGVYDENTIELATQASNHWNNKLVSAAREYLKNSEIAK